MKIVVFTMGTDVSIYTDPAKAVNVFLFPSVVQTRGQTLLTKDCTNLSGPELFFYRDLYDWK